MLNSNDNNENKGNESNETIKNQKSPQVNFLQKSDKMAEAVRRRQERQGDCGGWIVLKMYVTKLCVRMSYVKRCKKIVCERVVRESGS